MKVVKSSPPWELDTIIPVKMCPFLSSVSRIYHMERLCKYGVHHNPLGCCFMSCMSQNVSEVHCKQCCVSAGDY